MNKTLWQMSPEELIDELLDCWRFSPGAAETLPARIVDGTADKLTERERLLVRQLEERLSESEWQLFPDFVALRERGQQLSTEYNSLREARERERRLAEEEAERQREIEKEALRDEDRRRDMLLAAIRAKLETNFLAVESFWENHPDVSLVSPDDIRLEKRAFVQTWARRELSEETRDLDDEQADAVAQTHGHVQVVARAGSGKTRVIATRAVFLREHCGVKPNEMLLLAFNKKAAAEMRERIAKQVGEDVPHVMTFHALAYAIVQHDGRILYDDTRAGEDRGQLDLSRAIQGVIDEHLRSREFGPRIKSLMLQHFREDWETISNGRFHVPIAEFLEHRRSLTRETLGGEYVKSFGERVIANALFEHDIDYRYEPALRWGDSTYRPDFTIELPDGKRRVVIEYFGREGDADYDVQSEEKRKFLASEHRDWPIVERVASDLARQDVPRFVETLLSELRDVGVSMRQLSEEEIWQRCAGRPIDSFTRLTKQFIGRCRLENLAPEELVDRISTHNPITNAERGFLKVVPTIYEGYLKANARSNDDDFSGLLWKAVQRTRTNPTFIRNKGEERGDLRNIRYLFIDEFQDFSEPFYQLVRSIRDLNSEVQVFAVGDDWQAINGFAGSELRYFRDFDDYFPASSRLMLRTNYRSGVNIVSTSNRLMNNLGESARSGAKVQDEAAEYDIATFFRAPVELVQDIREELAAYTRICISLLNCGHDVVLLGRRNIDWNRILQPVRSLLPEPERRRISGETVHGFKGKEADAVVLVGVAETTAPLIHSNWVFERLFGRSLSTVGDEERRLFYVALTRAREVLVIVSDGGRRSPFVESIAQCLEHRSWEELAPVPNYDAPCVEVRVSGDTYPIKQHPRKQGFEWSPKGKYWWKRYPAASFSEGQVRRQPWTQASGVYVEFFYDEGAEALLRPH